MQIGCMPGPTTEHSSGAWTVSLNPARRELELMLEHSSRKGFAGQKERTEGKERTCSRTPKDRTAHRGQAVRCTHQVTGFARKRLPVHLWVTIVALQQPAVRSSTAERRFVEITVIGQAEGKEWSTGLSDAEGTNRGRDQDSTRDLPSRR